MSLVSIVIVVSVVLLAFSLPSVRRRVSGACREVLDRTVRRNERREEALRFVRERAEASNEEIREHLGVSARSVVRYMDALERVGAVEQVGKTGQAVVYRATQS